MYTAYCEASRLSLLSRFSETIFSPSRLSALANDDVTLVPEPRILPLLFETAKVPAPSSTPACPAAEEPSAPIQASRSCHTQYSEAARCSPLSRHSKAPSRQLPPLVNGDVMPVSGSSIVPSRSEVIEVPCELSWNYQHFCLGGAACTICAGPPSEGQR